MSIKTLRNVCLVTLLLMASLAMAQDKPKNSGGTKKKEKPAAQLPAPPGESSPASAETTEAASTGTDEPAPAKESGDNSGMGTNMDIPIEFKKFEFNSLEVSPDGNIHAMGNVDFQGPEFGLKCTEFNYSKKTKILVATGSPVQLEKGGVHSECTKLYHDMDKKKSRLTGNPFIDQKDKDGSIMRTHAGPEGEITISQDAKGQPSVSIDGKGRRAYIEKIAASNANPAKQESKPKPIKVDPASSMPQIKLPEASF